jgi:hypothetical protein
MLWTCGAIASTALAPATRAPVARYTRRRSALSAYQPATRQPAHAIAALAKPVTSITVLVDAPHSFATADQKSSTPLIPIGERASAATSKPSLDCHHLPRSRSSVFQAARIASNLFSSKVLGSPLNSVTQLRSSADPSRLPQVGRERGTLLREKNPDLLGVIPG